MLRRRCYGKFDCDTGVLIAKIVVYRQMMVAGLAYRIAKRVDRSAGDEEVPKGAYQTTKLQVGTMVKRFYLEEPS